MDKLDRVVLLYREDKLLQSARLLQEVKAELRTLLEDHADDQNAHEGPSNLQRRLHDPEIVRITEEVEEVNALKTSLDSKAGWTLSHDSAESKVWYRQESGTSSHSLLIEGEIQAPLLNLVALMYEADLHSELLYFVSESVVLREFTPLRRAARFRVAAPWPLSDREAEVYAYGVDGLDADDNCVLVLSRSLRASDGASPEHAPARRPLPTARRPVRADVLLAGYELRPVAPGVTRVRFVFNVDPKLPVLPTALVNWAARTVCRWALRALESRARFLPPPYRDRMRRDAIYKWFAQRLQEYWAAVGCLDEYEGAAAGAAAEHRTSGTFDADAPPEKASRALVTSLLVGRKGN